MITLKLAAVLMCLVALVREILGMDPWGPATVSVLLYIAALLHRIDSRLSPAEREEKRRPPCP